jgi:[protein-PII] uridylyltransferase
VVHAAELATLGGVAVFTFTVSPRFGGLPDPALLRSDLTRVLEGGLQLSEALTRKERDYAPRGTAVEPPAPPRILWFDDEATGAVVLELRGTDRIGLLYRVAAALEECRADVRWAKASTLGASVVDSFGLAGAGGEGSLGRAERQRIEEVVLAAAG